MVSLSLTYNKLNIKVKLLKSRDITVNITLICISYLKWTLDHTSMTSLHFLPKKNPNFRFRLPILTSKVKHISK